MMGLSTSPIFLLLLLYNRGSYILAGQIPLVSIARFVIVAAKVMLNSTQNGQDCLGDSIKFVCSVEGSQRLQWAVESINTFFLNPIRLNTSAEDGHVLKPDPFPEIVNVTLLSGYSTGIILSKITVIVNARTIGKHVYCSDLISNKSIVIRKPRKLPI